LENRLDISISSGEDVRIAEKMFDDFVAADRNNQEQTSYRWPLYAGLIILACGNPWKFRKRFKPSNC
jgi:hypothetical protein